MPAGDREGPGLGAQRPQGAGILEVKTAPPQFAGLPLCAVHFRICMFTTLQLAQSLQETMILTPHLPRKDTKAQRGYGLLEGT